MEKLRSLYCHVPCKARIVYRNKTRFENKLLKSVKLTFSVSYLFKYYEIKFK